ncbi:MAG: hypothetical protein AB7D05_08645, partial [Mangrovibacterium sp.]
MNLNRRMKWKVVLVFLLSGMLTPAVLLAETTLRPVSLLCEMLENPLGIDVQHPRLSWQLHASGRNNAQTAYRILAASDPEKLAAGEGDLWDSGKVFSGQSILVPYSGKPLESRMRVYWKVKLWNGAQESSWSEPVWFEMGYLYYKDWSGRWIGFDRAFPWDSEDKFSRLSARYFRREFTVSK